MALMEVGKKNSHPVGLKPTPERKKFGFIDDYRLLNQNILFQSHVFKTWEHKSPLPSIFCLLNSAKRWGSFVTTINVYCYSPLRWVGQSTTAASSQAVNGEPDAELEQS